MDRRNIVMFNFDDEIQKGIKKSKNPKLAKENLDFLLNLGEKSLTAQTISQVLAITENVNSSSGHSAKHYEKHYGFKGGKLDIEQLNNILKTKYKDDMLIVMTMALAN